ncbi:conserved hypothetical protein [uncultured Desulfobacterium sp.]|uniref:Transposase IS200-like domain-containing protein n=1 Tax=uncultured Desulfobacterium sp. TaxID=201089 RepID=A0A445MV04_9BACT|nr:conserved hypothetical protein [uncultured Desulfobacterium sp.]SPD73273.1 conserved hypothetical protein [uncultured Desulfobacterium sp.]
MPRIARLVVKGEQTVYHVISRTALDGYVIDDVEKEFLLKLIKRLSLIYFAEVIGFCLMGSHFHLLVRMHPGEEYPDDEIKRRFKLMYGDESDKKPANGQIPLLRTKWASISEYVKEIKQGFSRFYNKLHHRKGFFWSERFKSIIVDNGDTLINCLAYIDLNPVRAGIVEKPEQYRWNSLGYHFQTNNKDDFLSMDFGLKEFGVKTPKERLRLYREFVYGKGLSQQEDKKGAVNFGISAFDKFKYRSRYFTDSGIIGTKAFVARHYQTFKHLFSSKHEKQPKTIRGLYGIYSLKRLAES